MNETNKGFFRACWSRRIAGGGGFARGLSEYDGAVSRVVDRNPQLTRLGTRYYSDVTLLGAGLAGVLSCRRRTVTISGTRPSRALERALHDDPIGPLYSKAVEAGDGEDVGSRKKVAAAGESG